MKALRIGALLVLVVLLAAVACAKATPTPTPKPTATPTPTMTPTPTAGPTLAATATPTATPRPTATPTVGGAVPSGELKVALERIGLPQFHPALISWPNESWRWAYGVHDPVGTFDENFQPHPCLYESWETTPDALIFHLRKGIQWQKGYGEMTAEDVCFSWDESARADSMYVDAPQLRMVFGKCQVVDKYTAAVPWIKPTPFFYLWVKWNNAASPSNINVFSKKYLEEQGENPPVDIGTGPFEMVSFITENKVELEAVRDHWRQTSHVAKVTVFEVRDPTTRVAMIRTGEVDIAEVPMSELEALVVPGSGLQAREMGLAGMHCTLNPTGQYYEMVDPYHDNAPINSIYARKKAEGPDAFAEWIDQHPWIGDVDDEASMERARKVRWAMALAIDKESLVRNVLYGYGAVNFSRRLIVDSEPVWIEPGSHESWAEQMPPEGDPDRARQLLDEAGYSNGFDADLLITVGARPEVEVIAEAIVPMLENVGIRIKLSRIEIQADQARGKELGWQELNISCGSREPWPLFQQVMIIQSSSIQIPEFEGFIEEAGTVNTLEALRPITQKYAEIMFHQQYSIGLVQGGRIFVTGSRVGEWDIIPGPGGHPNSFETVTLVK